LIGENGTLVPGSIKSASDYSYFASQYSGDHFRIIGDAANFIDPFFSSGVHIAMTGALSAALTICASIKGQTAERTAQQWHDMKVGIAHTRFLFVVLGAYQQMHLQSTPILTSDVNAQNFDQAFELFRPVIFGLADSSRTLENKDVQEMMDVFQSIFDPHLGEEKVTAVKERYGGEALSVLTPAMGPVKIKELAKDDPEGLRVLEKFDALRIFSDEVEVTKMGQQPLFGYSAITKQGMLGLQHVSV